MRLRDQVALTLPTLFLRIILGITFLWAGTGKLLGTYEVTGADAARLANIGILPTDPMPIAEPTSDPTVSDEPTDNPVDQESFEPVIPDPEDSSYLDEQASQIIEMIEDQLEDAAATPPALGDEPTSEIPVEDEQKIQLQSVQYEGTHYAASDFPDTMEVKQVYSIALMISKAADPGLTADSNPISPIMPAMLASNPWPKALSWAVAITEIAAGALLIIGFLTRISALSVFVVMLVALWMTQFGPAVIQSNDAILGFIERYDNPWASASYAGLLWQLALAAMAGSVFFMGSGAIGIDRVLFKPTPRDPYIHGDPKAAKIKKSTQQPAPDRSEFDRTPNPTP
ncbi:MAG: DoxX family membrane protein [Phycisphaerales bacterium]|nr:DoxX family membrane protein [Phycisphaerales bacterium]